MQLGGKPEVSVVTVLKNRFENFRHCVDFLKAAENSHLIEHVVVDFKSDDGEVPSLYDSQLKLRHILTDLPFSINVGRNLGILNAASNLIFLCDSDILVDKYLLEILEDTVARRQMFFPIVRELSSQCERTKLADAVLQSKNWGRTRPFGYGIAGFRREDWEHVGRFDEERFKCWGRDDIDFFMRARRSCRTIRTARCDFFHLHHDRTPSFLNKYYGASKSP